MVEGTLVRVRKKKLKIKLKVKIDNKIDSYQNDKDNTGNITLKIEEIPIKENIDSRTNNIISTTNGWRL